MARRLPTVTIGVEEYFIDDRLGELRNVCNPHDVKVFTCFECGEKGICDCVYDPYNTDGECLAMK